MRKSDQAVSIQADDGTPVVCPECSDGRFTVDLLIPGGLRFTCWDCQTVYTAGELARAGGRQVREGRT